MAIDFLKTQNYYHQLLFYREKSRVAKIVSHHDAGVQRGEIQGGDWLVVVAPFGLDNRRPLEIVFAGLAGIGGDHEVVLFGFADQLRHNLDLLASGL